MARSVDPVLTEAAALYNKIRTCVDKGGYGDGLTQGKVLFSKLCGSPDCESRAAARPSILEDAPAVQQPGLRQRAVLTVAAVGNLLHCAAECAFGDELEALLSSLTQPLQHLPSWIRCASDAYQIDVHIRLIRHDTVSSHMLTISPSQRHQSGIPLIFETFCLTIWTRIQCPVLA